MADRTKWVVAGAVGVGVVGGLWYLHRRRTRRPASIALKAGPAASNQENTALGPFSPSKARAVPQEALVSGSGHLGVPVYRICLTGGPCAGKTTALTVISERLSSLGFRVFLVPEAATLLNRGGAMISNVGLTQEGLVRFQTNLIRLQMSLEDIFTNLARDAGVPSVVVCDRGVMDGSAYISDETWQALVDEQGWTSVQLRDRRYDAVLHLVTAARGAEHFFSDGTNKSRYEDLEGAREIDERLQRAWIGHPHFCVIDNHNSDFDDKMRRVAHALFKFIGLPTSITQYRKFIVKKDPKATGLASKMIQLPVDLRGETFDVEETYLVSVQGEEAKIRRRGQNGSYTYVLHRRLPCENEKRLEVKRQISAREYVALMTQKDPQKRTVKKRRQCFLWDNQYFVVDAFIDPSDCPTLLRVEVEEERADVRLPPFVTVERECSWEDQYTSYAIASKTA